MVDLFSFFSWPNLALCASVLAFFVILIAILHKCSLRTRRIAVYAGAIVLVTLEIIRYIVIAVQQGGLSKDTFSFQFCNILAIYIPISVLAFSNRYMYATSAIFGFVAGLAIVLLPATVLYADASITYLSAQSIFSHGLMAFIAYMIFASRMYEPDIKRDLAPIFGIFMIFCAFMKMMCYVYNDNFFGLSEFLFFGWEMPFEIYFPCLYMPIAILAIYVVLKVALICQNRPKRAKK